MRILKNVNEQLNKRNNEVLKEWSLFYFFFQDPCPVRTGQSRHFLNVTCSTICSREMIVLTCSLTAEYRLLTRVQSSAEILLPQERSAISKQMILSEL